MLKYFARVIVFTLALAGAVFLTGFYESLRNPTRPTPPDVAVGDDASGGCFFGAPVLRAAPPVLHKAKLITLDAARRESYTTLELECAPHAAAPEKLWVWTCFFVPSAGAGRCWSSQPVEVLRPFASGNRATVTIQAPSAWYGEAGAPVNGFHALVRVSTLSAEDARVPVAALNFDITTATPVVVQEPRTPTSERAKVVAR